MYETSEKNIFSELYDVHPQAIIWMKPVWSEDKKEAIDFLYDYSNPEGLKYLQFGPEQIGKMTLRSSPTVDDELRSQIFQKLIQVLKTGKASQFTLYNHVLNKHARALFARLRGGVLTVVQDITEERKIIEKLEEQSQLLREQKNLLDNILANSSNGISVSETIRDENGKIIDALTIMANDAAVNYIGLPREPYLTKKASELDPDLVGSPYFQACVNTLDTGEPFVMQYLVESTGKWLELTVSKLDDNHLIHVFTDVTPVKEVQLELEKTAETLRSVFDYAQTGMFTFAPVYDEHGEICEFRFIMVNSTLATYAGMRAEELEGQSGASWFPGYLTNGEFDLYKKCFLTGEPQHKELFYHFNGKEFYLDLNCVKMDGQLLVTLTDHTSLRKSQIELEQTIRALELSNTNLEDFAHAASHDLKEPLRKIRTFTDRLESMLEDRLSEVERSMFKRIGFSAERMQMLVDDLLEFSQVSEKPHAVESIDLNEKLKRVLSDLELQIEEKSARIHIDSLPVIKGVRRQIQQLFQNLVGNALKYSKAGVPSEIHISSKEIKGSEAAIKLPSECDDKKFHLITVTDNGIGFEQEYAEQIFKMFQRLHGKSEYSGTGVGLSIARKVVENHQGFIWAEGEPDKGARFNILLPVNG